MDKVKKRLPPARFARSWLKPIFQLQAFGLPQRILVCYQGDSKMEEQIKINEQWDSVEEGYNNKESVEDDDGEEWD